jgi:hypothetical protein
MPGVLCAAADGADDASVCQQLNDSAREVIGALVRIAFLEQQPPLAQFAHGGLPCECAQVLVLEPVKRRECTEQAEFESCGIAHLVRMLVLAAVTGPRRTLQK